jgi:hypothetical protein
MPAIFLYSCEKTTNMKMCALNFIMNVSFELLVEERITHLQPKKKKKKGEYKIHCFTLISRETLQFRGKSGGKGV